LRRSLALASVGLLLLLGAWGLRAFLDGGRNSARAAQPDRAGPASPARSGDAGARAVGTAAQAPTAAPESRAAVADTVAVEHAAWIVQVVDGLSRSPLAGARMRYVVLERGQALDDHPGWKLDTCDAWLEEHGDEAASDSTGRAELRAPAGSRLLVAGWAPQRFGRRTIDEPGGAQPIELALKPDVTLEVHTVGPGHAPLAGALVALRQAGNAWGGVEVLERTSDARGRVLYPHLGQSIDLGNEAWVVVAPTLLGRVDGIALDARELPDEPLVLPFPATGSVEVRVSTLPGLPPIADGAQVTLLVDEGKPDELLSFWTRPQSTSASVEGGTARFDFVPVGLDLIAEAASDAGRMPTRARGRGPAAVGETATLALVVGGDHPIARVRLLDSHGTPLAGREVVVRLDQEMSNDESGRTCDEDGRLLVDLPRHVGSGEEAVLQVSIAAQDGAPGARARLPLPEGLQPGLNDLGDLTLGQDRPLVAGRVVSPDGSGLEGLEIGVAALHNAGGTGGWTEELPVSAKTGPDGVFVVHGRDPELPLRVWARGELHRSRPVECAAGTQGLVLELERTGNVAGRVRLDDGVDATQITVLLQPGATGSLQDRASQARTRLDADGRFQVAGLSPGRWTLELSDSSSQRAVARLDDIDVPSGDLSRDPRLVEIDLRGRLAQVRLTLEPPEASDVVMGSLVYRPSGTPAGGEEESTAFLHRTSTVLCVAGRAADVTVQVSGFRTVELAGVRGDVTVRLQRGPSVRLKLPAGATLPKPPRFLKPFLTSGTGASPWGGHFQQEVFDERREVLLHAPGPGPLEVHWYIEERSENTLSTMAVTVTEPQVIEVLDREGEQVFEVTPPAFDP
jgi:hypothetical protein